jgi:hypothetical protein
MNDLGHRVDARLDLIVHTRHEMFARGLAVGRKLAHGLRLR